MHMRPADGGRFRSHAAGRRGCLRAVRELLHEVSSFSAGSVKIWTVWQSRPCHFACKPQTFFKPFAVSPVQVADARCKPEEHAAVDCQTGPFLTLDGLWADMRSRLHVPPFPMGAPCDGEIKQDAA
ncbi:hypothetical protein CE91St32_24050 [Gordonibacter pamelaeae]|nr:hypothetical protein CE91St32_24050 [Gordonibacter pamelaeae]